MKEEDLRKRHPVWDELDDLTRRRLIKAMREPQDEEGEFIAVNWVGSCVHCGSERTMDLCEVEGVENAAVGLCKDCGGLWCTECRAPIVTPDLECGHFAVCEECGQCLNGVSDLPEPSQEPGDAEDMDGEGREGMLEDRESWMMSLEETLIHDLFEDSYENIEEYIDPFCCEKIRGWLIEKGFYTREDFEEYDRIQREEDGFEDSFCEAMLFCAWCRRPFDTDGTIFTSRLELKPGLELEGREGLVVPLRLHAVDKVVPAIFLTLPATGNLRIKGLNVVTCSLECLEALREAFNREREIIERFNVN